MQTIEFLSLEPFIPSGPDFEKSKQLFIELGFSVVWEQPGLAGFRAGACNFILQEYDVKAFAENLMLSIKVNDVAAFRENMIGKQLVERFGVRISPVLQQPYGKEVNVIDIAGVCWHFIES